MNTSEAFRVFLEELKRTPEGSTNPKEAIEGALERVIPRIEGFEYEERMGEDM